MLTLFQDNPMQANPDKFKMMVLNKCENDVIYNIMVNDTVMLSIQEARDLGVLMLVCHKNHISLLCQKAGKHVMSRLSKQLRTEAKLLFLRHILSYYEFRPLVWHHCGRDNIIKIEKVSCRALRFVYNDFRDSYSGLRSKASRPLMYV